MVRTPFRALMVCFSAALVAAVVLIAPGRTGLSTADAASVPRDHLLFATSGQCIACHSQVHAVDGEDISIGYHWRASVMANSARDPYFHASIRRETIDHPTAVAEVEDKCSTCHMPMQRAQAVADGARGQILKYLESISDGTAARAPEGQVSKAHDPLATLAADGVSCTLCHQIQPDNLGRRESLDGGFLIDRSRTAEERVIFGQYPQPEAGRVRLMHSATGFTQAQGLHLKQSELCATCHTLYTDALDDQGRPAGDAA